MDQYPCQASPDIICVEAVIRQIFHATPISMELATGGTFTQVYRIVYPQETFYLRMLSHPHEGDSFASEVAVHKQLCQMGVKVPEVVYFEHYNEMLRRSVMVTAEIKGYPISLSQSLLKENEVQAIVCEAGRDLARINTISVYGFGWMRSPEETKYFSAPFSTLRAFVMKDWESWVRHLAVNVLSPSDISMLERVLVRYDAWLDSEQSHLTHGDFSVRHIYQKDGQYTGIIDFTDCQGATSWYDLAYFHMSDGDGRILPYQLTSALVRGYEEIIPLPSLYEQHICFTSILIIIGRIFRHNLQYMSNEDKQYCLNTLRKDLVALLDE